MTLRKPMAALCLAPLLSACGGGDDTPPGPPMPPRDISITQPHLSAATPVAFAGREVRFDGGICGGGNGPLRATWHFDDGTPDTASSTHIYASAGRYNVRVRCADGSGNEYKYALTMEPVEVFP